MRILTVVYDLDIGGTQRAAVTFANAYARMGHDSAVLVTSGRGARERDLDSDVRVMSLDQYGNLHPGWVPDVVHLHSHGLDEGTVRHIRDLSTSDALWVEQNVFAGVTPWTDLLDGSFVFSRWCEHQYASSPGDGAPVALVPNPIDVSAFFRDHQAGGAIRFSHGIPDDAIVLGRVGQPQPYKWSPMLISAFESWAARESRAWLLLVGAPEDVTERALGSRFRERMTLIERVEGDDSLRAHYSAMDIFGHAARQGETFGYVLVEAALCEVPIVTLSTPWADNSQGEVVGHGVGGLVVTTARGFTSAVGELGADAPLRQRLGAAGRARMLGEYEAVTVATRALSCRDRLAPAHRRTARALLEEYSQSLDPPAGLRRAAYERGWNDVLAWLSGAQSSWWLGQRTLNRWGISRHGFSRRGGSAP